MLSNLNLLLILAFVSLSVVAMATDAWRMEIPNYIPIWLTVTFIPFAMFNSPALLVPHAAVGIAAFLVSTALFAAGWFGGGDVKFLGATALWVGPEMILPFLMIMSLSGVALSLVVAVGRHYIGRPSSEQSKSQRFRGPAAWVQKGACPYGVPIGLAGLIATAPGALI